MATYAWQSISNSGGTVTQDQDWNTPSSWVLYPVTNPPTTGTVPGAADTAAIWAGSVNVSGFISQTYPVSVDVTDNRVVGALGLAGIAIIGANLFPSISPIFGTPTILPTLKINGGMLDILGNLADSFAGTIAVPGFGTFGGNFTGGGTVDIGNHGTLEVGGTVGATIQVDFTDGASDLLRLDGVGSIATNAFAGVVNGFQTGDTILLSGVTALDTFSTSYVGNVLTVTDTTLGSTVAAIGVNTTGAGAFILNAGTAGLAITFGAGASAPPGTPVLAVASDSGTKGDNVTNITTPTFTGSGAANAVVTLYDNAAIIGTGTATAGGTWSIKSSVLTNGVHKISAKETVSGAPISASSGTISVTIDTIAPVKPAAPVLTDGIGGGATIASITKPIFSGTAEANSVVTLLDGIVVVGTATAAAGTGAWTIAATGLTFGANTITAKATDRAGNVSVASTSTVVTVVTLPPSVPVLAAASDSGTKGDNLTNVATPVFSGTGDPNAIISLLDSGTIIATGTVNSAGTWSVQPLSPIANGSHTITATEADSGGPSSIASGALILQVDTVAPGAPTPPVLADGINNTGSILSTTPPIFTGSAEAGSLVNLLNGGTIVGSATASAVDGSWTITPTVSLFIGNNTITARATDAAGNVGPGSGSTVVNLLLDHDVHWTKATGSFAVASNWSPTRVPTAADNAIIDAPGTYTVSSGANRTVKTLSMAANASLGITAGVFSVTGGSGTIGLGGVVNVGAGATLSLAGTLSNTGILNANASAAVSEILVGAAGATLTGGGHVNLVNNVGNEMTGAVANATLTNVNNIIAGNGLIGVGLMRLVNQAAGVINANRTTSLTIDTGANTVTNLGLLESTAKGGLVLNSVVNNVGGTIAAIGNGAIVDLASTVLGGTLTSTGGTLAAMGSTGTLDGRGPHTVTNSGYVQLPNGSALTLFGTIQNVGTIGLASTGDATSLLIGPVVTLTGGGKVILSNNAANAIQGIAAGSSLVNVNNTISGAGQLGAASLRLVNGGLINANQTAALTVYTTSSLLENSGTMEATGTGGLLLQNAIVDNVGGTLLASGAGAHLDLAASTVMGGTLKTAAGGVVDTSGGATLDGSSDGPLTNAGSIVVRDNEALRLTGTIVNNGTIADSAVNSSAVIIVASPVVKLMGTGSLVMSNNAGNQIAGTAATNRLINYETISGAGQFGTGSMRLQNMAGAVINANQAAGTLTPGSMTLNTGASAIINGGLMEATNTGGLLLQSSVTNAGGTIKAVGAGAHVDLQGATVRGGLVSTATGGVVTVAPGYAAAVLDGLSTGAIAVSGSVVVADGASLTLVGAINNTGTLTESGLSTATTIVLGNADATLTGGGTVLLAGNGYAGIAAYSAPVTLVNVNNIIAGVGVIGGGYMSLANQATGVINANQAKALTLNLSGTDASNAGLIEATSTAAGNGGLIVANTVIDNAGGTIAAAGVNSHVELQSSTIIGGTLSTTGGGQINVTGSGSLDGLTDGILFNKGLLRVANGAGLALAGTIQNSGTISLLAAAASTSLTVASPKVTLAGGGLVTLSNSANNVITGAVTGGVLINLDNTVAGGGNLGAGQIALRNSGTINGSVGIALVIGAGSQSVTNGPGGLLEGTGTGGLTLASGVVSNAGTVLAGDGSKVVYQSGATNANSAGGVLAGGTWEALSATKGATVAVTGGAVSTDAATIILSGTNSIFKAGDGTTFSLLESSLTTIDATGTLEILGNRNYTTGLALTDNGMLQIGGGTLTANGLTIGAGAVAKGFGTLNTKSVVNNGTVEAAGTMVVTGSVDPSSTGVFLIDNAGVLELAVDQGSTNKISFLGAGQLTIDHAAQFGTGAGTAAYAGPLLQHFGLNDKILLADITSSGLSLVNSGTGLLQINNGTTSVAALSFEAASLGSGSFHLGADALGRAVITRS